MANYATKEELTLIAKAYCEKWGIHLYSPMNINLVLKIKMEIYGH